ncbi:MAG: gluconokinase [Acidiferrobacterales bacterium]
MGATNRVYVLMGVSGSGKSAVGEAVAERLGIVFHDGDQYHPQTNIDKMSRGEPLNDADRQGWLQTLNELAHEVLANNGSALIVCSALKRRHREILSEGLGERVVFVYLCGGYELILTRLKARDGHFFKGEHLLQSQFDALEAPSDVEAITVSIDQPIEQVIDAIIERLNLR